MAYDGFSGGADDLGGYSGFDDSARFDSSFRAPDEYKPDPFGLDNNREGFDEFKGDSHGYGHPAPIYENEEAGGDMLSTYGAGYAGAEYASNPMDEGSYNKELDEDLFGGDSGGGPTLPPPEEMHEEGALLRQWKRENAQRLQEKEREEKEKLQQTIDDADDYKEKHKTKREANRVARTKENRDKEAVYYADQEHFHKTAGKQYWKAVTELVPKELPASLEPKSRQMKEKKEKKSTFVAIPGPKPGKPTDLGRFRQVLLKLKHNPPAHMLPPPPAPKSEAKGGEAGKEEGKGKENAPGAPGAAVEGAEVPEAPATPEQEAEPELVAAA